MTISGLRGRITSFRRDERGASALEFAIVGSIFIALCIGVIQFGLVLQVRNELAQAADRGIRFMMLDPDASDSTIQSEVEALLANYGAENLDVQIGAETIDATDYRTVTIDYEMQIGVPGLPISLVTLNASRKVPVES